MTFGKRAVTACNRAMTEKRVTERHVSDVLVNKDTDVQDLAHHLSSEDALTRRMAARIFGEMGDVKPLVEAVIREKEQDVLVEMLKALGKREDLDDVLISLLDHQNALVRESVINMYRSSGHSRDLFPLVFGEDDALVQRVKRYIQNEQKEE